MRYVLTSEQMQESDAYTIKNFTSSIELMERAGKGCFEALNEKIKKNDKILVVCGGGGNGGDGLVIARYLFENGYDVSTYLISSHLKNETEINLNRYKGKIIDNIYSFLDSEKITVIIDALLGVGVNSRLKDNYVDLINKLNEVNAYKVSIDINSGIDATSGLILGTAFKSDLTLTIQYLKTGHFLNDGKDVYNGIKTIEIGIKPAKPQYFSKILEKNDFKFIFEKRKENTNKGDYGRVALIGGSKLTPGALYMSDSALASLRCGVGYCTVCIPSSLYDIYALKNPENIYLCFNDKDGEIQFDKEKLDKLLHYSSLLVGPGIGVSEEVYKIISYLLNNYKGNLVLDADALNSLARYGVEILKNKVCKNVILAPHLKEFSRLINKEISEIKEKYFSFAGFFAKTYGVILNLKSNTSIITDGNEFYLNVNGNAGLAKGGSGDVLSGITLGLVNKDDEIIKRVACSAYLLGRSAELATQKINEYSLLARDVVEKIPEAINEIIAS